MNAQERVVDWFKFGLLLASVAAVIWAAVVSNGIGCTYPPLC